jgi:hypothetical protein
LLDTRLLVLLVAGLASREYVLAHKRLSAFTVADFDALTDLLSPDTRLIVTQNVLSEASNLLGHIREPARTRIFEAFRTFIAIAAEIYVPSSVAAAHPIFARLGLADAACLTADIGDAALLTADNDLYLAALRDGRGAFNFWHLRAASR